MSKKKGIKRSAVAAAKDETMEEEEAYFVEEILDKRIKNKKLEYFLKWRGYGPEDNSWVN